MLMIMKPFADGAEMAEACVDSQRHVVREMAMQTNHDLLGGQTKKLRGRSAVVVGVVAGGGDGKG